jgi:hypothetical protein
LINKCRRKRQKVVRGQEREEREEQEGREYSGNKNDKK